MATGSRHLTWSGRKMDVPYDLSVRLSRAMHTASYKSWAGVGTSLGMSPVGCTCALRVWRTRTRETTRAKLITVFPSTDLRTELLKCCVSENIKKSSNIIHTKIRNYHCHHHDLLYHDHHRRCRRRHVHHCEPLSHHHHHTIITSPSSSSSLSSLLSSSWPSFIIIVIIQP